MALDPFLRLRESSKEEVRASLRRLLRSRETYVPLTSHLTLVQPNKNSNGTAVEYELTSDQSALDLYSLLEHLGVVAVGYGVDRTSRTVKLAGASAAEVLLRLDQRPPTVRKAVAASKLDEADVGGRLLAELRWHHEMQRIGVTCLVPLMRTTLGDDPTFYDAVFVGRYTLGERLVQGRETSTSLVAKVERCLSELANQLYWRRNERSQFSYVQIVDKRYASLRKLSPFADSVWEDGVVVNGRPYPALKSLFAWLESTADLADIVTPEGGRECHGDLILDNILVTDGVARDAPLTLDPNPANCSPLTDVGKLAMNALVYYDLAIRDLIDCDHGVPVGERTYLNWQVIDRHPGVMSSLDALADWLFQERMPMTTNWGPRLLKAQAALHSLAIAPFHVLHHHAIGRGHYFVARGVQLLHECLVNES